MDRVVTNEDLDPLSYRRRRSVIPLENFDSPRLHKRAPFESSAIWSLSAPRMAGFSIRLTPKDIRDALLSKEIDEDTKSYLRQMFEQMGPLDIRLFRHNCGASLYELARTMIECEVTHPMVAQWMNCKAPNYRAPEYELRIYRLGVGPTAGWF